MSRSFEEKAHAAVERVKDAEMEENERLQERFAELRKDADACRAEREEHERQEAEGRRELREAARAGREEEEEKRAMLRSWVAAGGAEGDFEAAWSDLRAETLKRRTLEADAAARASQWTISSI